MDDLVRVELTEAEVVALLCAYDINEYPVSNALGRDGGMILDAAEAKLRDALATKGVRWTDAA